MRPVIVTQNNTPTLDFILYGKDGKAAPLEGNVSSVTLKLVSRTTGAVLVADRSVTVVLAAGGGVPGEVKWPVTAPDSAVADSYQGKFTANWLVGGPQSYPDDGMLIFTVVPAP